MKGTAGAESKPEKANNGQHLSGNVLIGMELLGLH
jgi:hypothetical protein